MNALNLAFFKDGKKLPVKDVVERLTATDRNTQCVHAKALLQDARTTGFGVAALLHQYTEPLEGTGLTGLESIFAALNVPTKLKAGDQTAIAAFAATSSAFVINDGLKPLMPILVDNLLRDKQRTPPLERVEDLLANTRQVKGTELQTGIEFDKTTDDSYAHFVIAETAQIPTRTLKTTSSAVKFLKYGHAIRISYELDRVMSPDILVPMANRIQFERDMGEARAAVNFLINGDGSADKPAAVVDTLVTYDSQATGKLRNRAEGFMKWLVACAKAGRPIDTIVCDYDTLMELSWMFPVQNAQNVPAVGVGALGNQMVGMTVRVAANIAFNITVVVSSAMGANQILGYRVGETLERLIESGSQISETEKSIGNQTILYTNTISSGFNLFYVDSRRVLTWTPA